MAAVRAVPVPQSPPPVPHRLPLEFLDFITYQFMIDNVVLLISGTLHGRSVEELLDKCHPLGMFDEIPSLSVAQTPTDLYQSVIIDTPLAPFFQGCLSSEDLNELNVEIIRSTLYRSWLEAFHAFCTDKIGGATATVMSELLFFEADRRAINITLISFGTELSRDDRIQLYPRMGLLYAPILYPYTERHPLARTEDAEQVRAAMEPYPVYRRLFNEVGLHAGKSLESAFFEREISMCHLAFLQMFQYGVHYAWLRLKEQEIRNLMWVCECLALNRRDKVQSGILYYAGAAASQVE